MRTPVGILLAALTLAVPAALQAQTAPAAQLSSTADRSTPERALRSYWRVMDVQDSLVAEDASNPPPGSRWLLAEDAYRSHLTGPALASYGRTRVRNRYSRQILGVERESPTRVLIRARIRNVTPIPPGAVPTEFALEARNKGEEFRYIFEKVGQEWKLAQIQTWWESSQAWNDLHDASPYVPALVIP
jgi:hypothetical protein